MDLKLSLLDDHDFITFLKNLSHFKKIPLTILSYAPVKEDPQIIKIVDGFVQISVGRDKYLLKLVEYHPYKEVTEVTPQLSSITTDVMEIQLDGDKKPTFNFRPEEKAKIPELVRILEEEKAPVCFKLKETFTIYEVEAFARDIMDLGEKYQVEILWDWANSLLRQTQLFEMDEVPKTIEHCKNLLEEIRKLGG